MNRHIEVPVEFKIPKTYSVAMTSGAATSFATALMESFSFLGDKETIMTNQDFLSGSFVVSLNRESSEEDKKKYYQQCLRALDWSFSERVVRDVDMGLFFAGAIEDMEAHINSTMDGGLRDPESMREHLPLDSVPFRYARRFLVKNIQELPKDDEIRLACQALFLYLLRPRVPVKYADLESFLEKYPELRERNATEQDRLRHTANWMDLAFYTIQPRNNKTFILNIIPRIIEGRNARYITGSGQTKPTADRVNIFRLEGNCEKIKRPPRRKKEEILAATVSASGKKSPVDPAMIQSSKDGGSPTDISKFPYDAHPFMHMGYPMGFLPPNQWMQYGGMPWAGNATTSPNFPSAPAFPLASKGGDIQMALLRRLAAAKVASSLENDPRSGYPGYLPGYWTGSNMNVYNRGAPVHFPSSSFGSSFTNPMVNRSEMESSAHISPSNKAVDTASQILGKRKSESEDSEQPNKTSNNLGCGGLHLLFAAVNSLEAAHHQQQTVE